MIEHGLDVWGSVASVIDVAQVVQAAEKTPAWLGGTLGFAVVMTALSSIWLATSVVGAFFVKRDAAAKGKSAPGKTEAAPKAPAAAQASAATIAAAAYTVSAMGQQLRNVVVHVPGRESVSWASQGRQTIYAGHAAKAPQVVNRISSVVKK